MYTERVQLVREVLSRLVASRLNDEDCTTAAFYALKAFRDNPRSFGDYRETTEPVNLLAAFQWADTDPKLMAFWTKVNDAMTGLYGELLAEAQFGDLVDENLDDCDGCCDSDDCCEEDLVEIDELFLSRGPVAHGWTLFNKDTGETLPVFVSTRQAASDLRDPDETVSRAVLFSVES